MPEQGWLPQAPVCQHGQDRYFGSPGICRKEYGTQRCEVIIHIGASRDFPDINPWVVSTVGFRFKDSYQAIARKALRYQCQIYEKPICRTPMRFFPPFVKNSPVWVARMKTLEGPELREGDPTTIFMTDYLLSLDKQYDR